MSSVIGFTGKAWLTIRFRPLIGAGIMTFVMFTCGTQILASPNRQSKQRPRSTLFSNSVDWYAPPPFTVGPRRAVLPSQLFSTIPISRRLVATALLDNNKAVSLSSAQVARLTRSVDIKAIARNEIAEKRKELHRVRDRARMDRAYKLMRLSEEEIRLRRRMDESTAQNLESEIWRWQTWEGHLKPYLIRAVALNAGGNFTGVLVDDNLVVEYSAMGNGPLRMEKCPVIVYLPIKPKRVYTSVGATK